MKHKRKIHNTMRCFCYDNQKLNKRLICLRKSFWEVYHILNPKCMP
ncbi:hypothetical protein NE683_15880 [Bariatricus massiliensis]|nr:hypothetical protein [Bariatricus massiliensis]MDY2661816.1 hypothetical protein [Bariatricus massiliensis]